MKPKAMLEGIRTFAMAVCFLTRRSARPIGLRQDYHWEGYDLNLGAAELRADYTGWVRRAVRAARDAAILTTVSSRRSQVHPDSTTEPAVMYATADPLTAVNRLFAK